MAIHRKKVNMSGILQTKSDRTKAGRPWQSAIALLAGAALPLATQSPALSAPMERQALGVVIADEPNAAIVARDILEAGGNVADAATALYFTLAVTYPVAAGLGGGGLCLHYDPKARLAQSISFLPRASREGGTVAVPGAVRGFSYIHGRYGSLRWPQLIAPAEALAAKGFPLSHALWNALNANLETVKKSALFKDFFIDQDGKLLEDGDGVIELATAGTLALISGRGPIGFYGAPFGTGIVHAAERDGGALSASDLYDYRVEDKPAAHYDTKAGSIFAPDAKTGAGALAGQILPALTGLTGGRNAEQFANAARNATGAALDQSNVGALPKDFGSTGFLVADAKGEVLACGLTMTKPFGTGHEVEKAGFVLAPAPRGDTGLAGAFLMPLIATTPKSKDILFAGVGSGGPDAVSAVSALAIASYAQAPALIEPTWSSAEKAPFNSVNMLSCGKGLLSEIRSCKAASDPHGHGVALQGESQSKGGQGFLGLF